MTVIEWWNKFNNSSLWTGAWCGMPWEDLPELAQTELMDLFYSAKGAKIDYDD